MINKSVEVIVVGAGPSGLACAQVLASSGFEVLVFEKANKVGTKTFTSGMISKHDVFEGEEFFNFERCIVEQRTYLLNEDSFISTSFSGKKNYFVVNWEDYSFWSLNKVLQSGGRVNTGQLVKDLIVQDGKIIGIKTEDNEYYSNVVVLAEGVKSLITKKSGLRTGEFTPKQVFLFVEEEILLTSKIIEERLNLQEAQGLQAKLFTSGLLGLKSIGYFYTRKDSLVIGIGVLLSESISRGINVNECMEKMKKHSLIYALTNKGVTKNYISYILPISIGGTNGVPLPRIYSNGCLLVGGAATLVSPFSWDLSSLAILSGKLAAQTIIGAKELNDFSEKGLSHYGELVKKQILDGLENDIQFFFKKCNSSSLDLDNEVISGLGKLVLKS